MPHPLYTPGPWIVAGRRSNEDRVITPANDTQKHIAFALGWCPVDAIKIKQNRRANAALIAAAPEMFEALEEVRDKLFLRLEGCPDPDCFVCQSNDRTKKLVTDAIRKAQQL